MHKLGKIFTFAMLLTWGAQSASAGPIRFDDWSQHWFARFANVDFTSTPKQLNVQANGAVSIIHKPLDDADWSTKVASWDWAVTQSVPATDLQLKGGDDRNLALYFAFLPKAEAQKAKKSSLSRLLKNPHGRVLVYVWGGDHKRGENLGSPYLGARGKMIVLRGSGTGAHSEKINLVQDFRRAFNTEPTALVALAISSDSDDTNTVARSSISNLVLKGASPQN